MKILIRYLFFIYYVPKLNIFYRVLYLVKRRFLHEIYKNIGNKYLLFSSKLILREVVPKGNILPLHTKKKSLPIEANLFGYFMKIDRNVDWYPENLNYGICSERLSLHYMDYLKELEFKEALFLIEKWILHVSPYTNYYWRDSWNCYGLSKRVINWIDLISENDSFSSDKDKRSFILINKSIEYQVDFLINNLEIDICGNHLIKNIRCILRACSYFKGRKTKKWFKKISNYLLKALDKQFLDDGMHYELSPSYHNSVAEDLLCIRRSFNCFCNDVNPKITKEIKNKIDYVLSKIYSVILRLTHPDGFPSLFSDGGLNSCTKPLIIAKKIKDVLDISDDLENFNNLNVWKLDTSGFYGLRFKDNCFITKCGDLGADSLPAHGQSDSLSFEWSVEGYRIIVDQGVFTYHPGKDRDFSRSTNSHNTLTLNNLDQSDCWSSFKVGRRARTNVTDFKQLDNGFYLKAFHNGYKNLKGHPLVFRNMNISPDKLLIEDIVNTYSDYNYSVKNRILLAPNIHLEKIKNQNKKEFKCLLSVNKKNNDSKDLLFLLTSENDFIISDTYWFPDFGVKLKTKRIVFDLGNTPCKSNWSLIKL